MTHPHWRSLIAAHAMLSIAAMAASAQPRTLPPYITGLGTVTPYTVAVEPRVSGQLMTVNFKEGDVVQAGQLLATIDPQATGNPALSSYTQITAPITGVTGLRLIDPGNLVHAGPNPSRIVVITQTQPIAVLFTVPEEYVRQIWTRLKQPGTCPVEALNREGSRTIATGRLVAIDNQIDSTLGMIKVKAMFDNKDGALFPGQFVTAKLFLGSR